MHSHIFSFSTNKDCKLRVGDVELDRIQHINNSTDYIGEDYSVEETLDDEGDTLMSIFPPFIKVDENGVMQVSPKSQALYRKWIKSHIRKVRKWQDVEYVRRRGGTYIFEQTDVVTESKDSEEWFEIDSIFNIVIDGDNYFNGYTEFIEELACYHEGETLYLIGSTDYHF